MNLTNCFTNFKSMKVHTMNIQDETKDKMDLMDTQDNTNPLADKLEDLKNKVEAFKKEFGIKN